MTDAESMASDPVSAAERRISTRSLYHGSLYHWSLIGFLLVTLPLVMALISGLLSMSKYTEQSQQALFQTVRANEGGRTLLERLVSMERSIRQYQVLKDPELLSVYRQHHNTFISVGQGLRFYDLADELRVPLEGLVAAEEQLYQHIQSRLNRSEVELTEEDLQGYVTLTLQARALLQTGGRQVGVEAEALAREADRVRRAMLLWAALAVPLALILGLLFVYLLTRPIRRIERVISELGAGRFDRPIVIHGPRDLVDLGRHLDWMRQRLMALEGEKQRFIRNISHELKTPLATLREGADLLADQVVGELNQEQREIVQLMTISALQLNGLVENLLEYQRLANRDTLAESSEFDLALLLRKVLADYRLLVRSKRLVIMDELVPLSIQGDREAIRMMLGNLLSNAIKFSPDGGRIRLSLSVQQGFACLLIEDQGEGISAEDQPFVFQEFYQGKGSSRSGVKGSGLGLALVNDTIQRHHGRISLLPVAGEYTGARIRLELPRVQEQLPEVTQ
ncbi:sensor histidine kinase [Sedimenticola hydrogenitrophicus]|uniref:sensor histidine kinase n=1 Tax=Sedimenticola hydrogenitrophicus TaxID=2967975 RepID=UPI002739F853|nr:ATP-binding protein [Sedimenticola hydrogenitrophicus]